METRCLVYWSEHARQRARERFAHYSLEDLAALFAASRRIGKKTRRAIKDNCPQQRHWMEGGFRGRYITIHTRTRIIFVMASAGPNRPDLVITIFPLEDRQHVTAAAVTLAQAIAG